MRSRRFSTAVTSFFMLAGLFLAPLTATAQDNPPRTPIDLPCATNAFAQVLGSTPVNDGSQVLVQARVIFGEGGMIDLHTHPGTLIVTVESGEFGFTHMSDGEMVVNRAATSDREASQEPLPHGTEVPLAPGDWFVETGMIHRGTNLADGETTVILSGLIEPDQPLTICTDVAATPHDLVAARGRS